MPDTNTDTPAQRAWHTYHKLAANPDLHNQADWGRWIVNGFTARFVGCFAGHIVHDAGINPTPNSTGELIRIPVENLPPELREHFPDTDDTSVQHVAAVLLGLTAYTAGELFHADNPLPRLRDLITERFGPETENT